MQDVEISRYTRASIPWTAKQLVKMMNGGTIIFDNTVQRACVWNKNQKSKLILSMIANMPIGSLMTYKHHDAKVYDCLDGKQRSHAIKEYIEGKFALVDGSKVSGTDVGGKYIHDLPDNWQDYIKDYSLNVIYFDTLTMEQQEMVFLNVNNGKPISNIDRAWVRTKAKDQIKMLSYSPLFDNMTEQEKEKRKDKDIVIKCCAMYKMDEPCLDSKEINPFISQLVLTNEEQTELNDILYKIYKMHEEIKRDNESVARKIYKVTHLTILVPFVKNHGIQTEFITKFFTGNPSMNQEYNAYSQSGVNHAINIKMRMTAIEDEWKRYNSH